MPLSNHKNYPVLASPLEINLCPCKKWGTVSAVFYATSGYRWWLSCLFFRLRLLQQCLKVSVCVCVQSAFGVCLGRCKAPQRCVRRGYKRGNLFLAAHKRAPKIGLYFVAKNESPWWHSALGPQPWTYEWPCVDVHSQSHLNWSALEDTLCEFVTVWNIIKMEINAGWRSYRCPTYL